MIISTEFLGDSLEVSRCQHDVYSEALDIIVNNCNRLALFARGVIKSDNFQNWGNIYTFDHRTLQFHHDLLATVWRYETQASQLRLDCKEDKKSIQLRWLDWLTIEVNNWIERPDWVRFVQIILDNQNTTIGQRTETLFSLQIMDYFSEVPWKTDMKSAFVRELEKNK
jgi:hypothetical protein